MTRRNLFKRCAALVGVAVASRLPMPEPGPVALRGTVTGLKPPGGITWISHTDGGVWINGEYAGRTLTGGGKP